MLIHDIVPPRRPGRTPAWCLVIHGLGDSKHGWQEVVPMLGLDHVGFIFAQAPIPYGPGWSWFDILPGMGADVAGVRRSRALLDDLIGHVLTTQGITPDRLALMGFSQGCLMALDQGWHRDRVFAGIVGISGFTADTGDFPAAWSPAAQRQRILWTHGHYDDVVPIGRVRIEAKHLAALDLAIDWREYPKDHGLDPEHEIGDITRFLGTALA